MSDVPNIFHLSLWNLSDLWSGMETTEIVQNKS